MNLLSDRRLIEKEEPDQELNKKIKDWEKYIAVDGEEEG